jgi:2-iminobutanoate/2-iminopropanoate deaminase
VKTSRHLNHGPPSPQGLPYSTFVRAGDFVYLAGLTGDDREGNYPDGGIEDEARQLLRKAGTILEQAECSFADLVKVIVSIRDPADIPAFNDVYVQYVPYPLPARTMQCVIFDADARVGIELIAYKPQSQHTGDPS